MTEGKMMDWRRAFAVLLVLMTIVSAIPAAFARENESAGDARGVSAGRLGLTAGANTSVKPENTTTRDDNDDDKDNETGQNQTGLNRSPDHLVGLDRAEERRELAERFQEMRKQRLEALKDVREMAQERMDEIRANIKQGQERLKELRNEYDSRRDDLAKAQGEFATMAAQIAALRKFRKQ
jgi:peptidoglycan hydrolase CwlO-like protein